MNDFFPPPPFVGRLKKALSLDHPYKLVRDSKLLEFAKKDAAILVLFSVPRESEKEIQILFIQRSDTVPTHPGQYAFPGGRVEESDHAVSKDRFLEEAALRESFEEIALNREGIEILGRMPSLVTFTSFFLMTPVVGWTAKAPEEIPLQDSHEVSRHFWLKWNRLLEPSIALVEVSGRKFDAPFYPLSDDPKDRIWGASAVVIENLADRLAGC